MFLPIGDFPNPKGYSPWVTWLLIAANVLVYLLVSLPLGAQGIDPSDPLALQWLQAVAGELPPGVSHRDVLAGLSAHDLFVFEHGYKPGAPSVADLFSSLFLHSGLAHLGGNMLFLWIYGDNVEHRLGRLPYLAAYLLTGAAATLSFGLLAGDSMVPLVGASGAISGVLGFYFLLFPRNMVRVFVFFFPFIMRTVNISARVVLGAYVVFSNLLPLLAGGDPNVAYGAHLGGFFAGLALAWLGERAGWSLPKRVKAASAAVSEVGALRAALAARDGEAALAAMPGADLSALTADESLALAKHLTAAGLQGSANRVLRQAMGGNPDPERLAQVRLQLGLMRLEQGQAAAAYHHLVDAMELAPGTETARRAEAALASVWGAR